MDLFLLTPDLSNVEYVNAYLQLADYVFLADKGRGGSLRKRYPALFGFPTTVELALAVDNGHVVGGLTLKRCVLNTMNRKSQGAMIGFVCVSPHARGMGIGKELLTHAVRHLEQGEIEFAVLWTTIHRFYEDAGWHQSDCGRLGECTFDFQCQTLPEMDPECWSVIDAIRAKYHDAVVARTREDYLTIPTCVEKMHCLVAEETMDAYVLVGSKGSVGIVFEMCGNAARFPQLWKSLSCSFSRLLVNQSVGSPAYAWFVAETSICWSPQEQTMWMPLGGQMDPSVMKTYVPYFDRI